MTQPTEPESDPYDVDDAVLDELSSILADPSMWEAADPADEEAIVAAIGELAGEQNDVSAPNSFDAGVPDSPLADVVSISSFRRWAGPIVAGVAAAMVILVGASALTGGDDRSGIDLALAPTDLAPGAEGVVEIIESPNGTVLLLDVSGLPPAPEGSYYEAWVRQDAEVGVSAGTFHLRGGGGEIELWAGVSTDDYPLFTVTLQEEAQTESSGQVVLRGRVGD